MRVNGQIVHKLDLFDHLIIVLLYISFQKLLKTYESSSSCIFMVPLCPFYSRKHYSPLGLDFMFQEKNVNP